MKIILVTPAPRGSLKGNRITANRWAGFLRDLGHRVKIVTRWNGESADVLVAMHAKYSHESVVDFRKAHPARPLILALPGTDLYRDLRGSAMARKSLELADRFVVLQPEAIRELPKSLRRNARVIYQSLVPPRGPHIKKEGVFEVTVLGHLRKLKDPFRAALAARELPDDSRIRVLQLGEALEKGMAAKAKWEEKVNPRYRWLGGLSHARTLRILARSRLMVISSEMEGGANAVTEAIACGVPVISSRIPGSTGLLGRSYPGFYPVRDTRKLARLLQRAEADKGFLGRLKKHCAGLRPITRPALERRSWKRLLAEVL